MTELNIQDYTYDLPQERIALYPLPERDKAKLLVYKNGPIEHSEFTKLTDFLPENAFLFFNDTRVIPARIHFQKTTGADIEIFLLDPIGPSTIVSEAMAADKFCTWHCTVGNLKRWTENLILTKQIDSTQLEARLIDRENGLVQFSWSSGKSFAEIISSAGETPLPPYLKRKPEAEDRTRYQTVYSHYDGAVAAPTAGLHFTENVFQSLKEKNIGHDFLTLHVSAGTFQPMKTQDVLQHTMHREQIVIRKRNIESLLKDNRFIIPVGTTSMRTLESLYWYGVKLIVNPESDFLITQTDPYTISSEFSLKDVLTAVLNKMNVEKTDFLIGETGIFIYPGYQFRACKALITNFHQPGSTLILLVAAFAGKNWRKIYHEALSNGYRFLSYGDSSLLFLSES
jgi:S-adenosylmethionine:tRNA ribosyltransferase-isomerase